MSLIRKHGAVLQAWACLDLVFNVIAIWLASIFLFSVSGSV